MLQCSSTTRKLMYYFNRKIKDVFYYTFAVFDYEPLEILNIIFLFFYAAGILNPRTDAFTTGDSYRFIATIMSEHTFGVVILFLALNGMFAFFDGNLRYRWWATFATASFWILVFSTIFAANNNITVALILIPCALMSVLPCSRIARDIKNNRQVPWMHQ